MQFERLRKSFRKQIIIGGLILVCVISAITITTTRAKYKLTEDIPLVKGSINYKEPDMRVVAISISEDGINYNTIDTIPTSGYQLNNTKSICKIANTDIKDEEITIEYKEGKLNILGVTKKGTRCYLYFDRKKLTAEDTLIKLNINSKDGVPNFKELATTDEGIYATSDGIYGGTTYYWRGAVTNNYVKFAEKCWRIVRINGDGSIRLIYDGTSCHANGTSTTESIAQMLVKYNNDFNNSSYVGWTYSVGSQRTLEGISSNAKIQTESWYNNNLANNSVYASKIADGKFCNDRRTQDEEMWRENGNTQYYVGYKRLLVSFEPAIYCLPEDTYILKVGAITGDEAIMAGGHYDYNNSYYLYNGNNYWTMTPYSWNGTNQSAAGVYYISSLGNAGFGHVHNLYTKVGIRPVINLKSDTEFQAGGNGTLNSPYVVA